MKISRRSSFRHLSALTLTPFLAATSYGEENALPLATNMYPWSTFAKRSGEKLVPHSDALLAKVASCGLSGYEPIINSPADFDGLADRLTNHGLVMRSIYVNSTLHDETKSDASIAEVLEIAKRAGETGTEIIVTNPSPIRWGGKEDKTDPQLRFQAGALDELGAELKAMGIALAYHNHDSELRNGAREFHHMLASTNPDHVKFCLDAHWIFRGCGNSEVAVFDVLKLYRDRIVELHLRQSEAGVWTEAFSIEGDIDYARLIEELHGADIHPNLVLEQAVESESANTMGVVEAHRKGQKVMKEFLL